MRYDVAVVGGGTTGVCAAIAAARGGADVLLVEANGFLGGNAANGLAWLGFHSIDHKWMVRGIPLEIIERVRALGGATEFRFDPICGSCAGVDPTYLKIALARMARDAGVHVRLHSMFAGISREGDGWAIELCEKRGRLNRSADILIDCTDTADAAFAAGARFRFGREADGKSQVSSCVIRVAGVDMDAFCAYFADHPDQLRPFQLTHAEKRALVDDMRSTPVFVMGAFPDIIARARADGLAYPRDRLIGTGNALTGELTLVASRVENVDPSDTLAHTSAEFEGLDQTLVIMRLLNEYLPGCQSARLMCSGHTIGVRETLHMRGRYSLTSDDLLRPRAFPDAIACGAYHLDIHSPDHAGLETRKPRPYGVPFRVCQPDNIENLLVAGRCVSADQGAQSSLRVIPILGAIGQACGTAAALAALANATVSALDAALIRRRLIADGAMIMEDGK